MILFMLIVFLTLSLKVFSGAYTNSVGFITVKLRITIPRIFSGLNPGF